ncbi:MAG: glycosyltransferase family 9 protein [Ignavibacteriaceae bacterium]|nr:glycosyltransferase family 9 protein [Ignavibacteriaceae bacterium]
MPSGGWASKRCDAVKWVEICKALNSTFSMKFLILWGPGDEQDADYIKQHLPDLVVMAPETSVAEMAGLINNCNLIIANDSGPMHISAALGVPTIGLFGPTDPKMHGPYADNSSYVIKDDLFCIICNKTECPYKHECFIDLPVDNVVKKAAELQRV